MQNFSEPGYTYFMERDAGSVYESPLVPNVLRPLANDPGQYTYHSDLLRDLGVRVVWHYSRLSRHLWNVPVPPLRSTTSGFYDLIRTGLESYDTSTRDRFLHDVREFEPALREVNLDNMYMCETLHSRSGGRSRFDHRLESFTGRCIEACGRQCSDSSHFATGDADFHWRR